MTQYRIIFENQSGAGTNVGFFTQPPIVNNNPGDRSVFTNIWIGEYVPDKGNFTIQTTNDFYAWVGTAPSSPAPGVTVSGGKGLLADLGRPGTGGETFQMTVEQGAPDIEPTTPSAPPSCFRIECPTNITVDQNYLVGMGQVDNTGTVVPAATITARPNLGFNIQPVVKYYVSQSFSKQGEIVNFQGASLDAGLIDFSSPPGLGQYGAKVTLQSNGKFSVSYMAQAMYAETVRELSQRREYNRLPASMSQMGSQDYAEIRRQLNNLQRLIERDGSQNGNQYIQDRKAIEQQRLGQYINMR